MTTYEYDITGKNIDMDQLTIDITNSIIAPNNMRKNDSTILYITFTLPLTIGQKTQLDTIVANHIPVSCCAIAHRLMSTIRQTIDTSSYTNILNFYYPAPMEKISLIMVYFVGKKTGSIVNYTIQIKDVTHGDAIIAEQAFTNTSYSGQQITPLSNLPNEQAIFEVNVKVNGSEGSAVIDNIVFILL